MQERWRNSAEKKGTEGVPSAVRACVAACVVVVVVLRTGRKWLEREARGRRRRACWTVAELALLCGLTCGLAAWVLLALLMPAACFDFARLRLLLLDKFWGQVDFKMF